MLCTLGTMEQYHACGLKTVKDQMRLRKLINDNTTTVTTQSSTSSNSSSQGSTPSNKRKLTKKELNELTPEDKRIYLMMYST